MVRDPLPHLATEDNRMVTLPIMADDLHFIAQILELVVRHGDPSMTRLVLAPDDRARACAIAGGINNTVDAVPVPD